MHKARNAAKIQLKFKIVSGQFLEDEFYLFIYLLYVFVY